MTFLTDEQLWDEDVGRDFAKHIWHGFPNDGVVLWINYVNCPEPVFANAFWLTGYSEQENMEPAYRDAYCKAAEGAYEKLPEFKQDVDKCCAGHRARRSIERSRGAA